MSSNGGPSLARVIQAGGGVPPLEIQAQKACEQEITAALRKYGCRLVWRETLVNGQRVDAGFGVLKKHDQQEQDHGGLDLSAAPGASNEPPAN